MSNKKRLLCIVYEPGHFKVWLELAMHGRISGDYDLILWSPYCLPDSVRYQAEALKAGTVYVEEATPAGGLADIFTKLSGWLSSKPIRLPLDLQAKISRQELPLERGNVQMLSNSLLTELSDKERYAVCCEFDRMRRRISICEDWLVRLGIDAVVLAEDNVERDSYAWIAAAKHRGIRTVVSSYGGISDQEAVNAYRNSTSHAVTTIQASLIRQCIPQWLAEGDGFSITRLPFTEAIARELTGTAPRNPWLVNTGHADVIAVESAAMKQAYLKFGFQATKLKPIGHPLHDTLAIVSRERIERRASLFARHNLSANRPLAVVAMPPDQTSSREGVYRQYAEMVSAFARLPSELAEVNVVVSPHPNISADGRALIRATGVCLVEVTVAELLPLADMYISSVSSTIKWALACGIPVINFDCYRYGYSDYNGVAQVIHVDDESNYRASLHRLRFSKERTDLMQLAKADASYWGTIDGMALSRLVELCFGE